MNQFTVIIIAAAIVFLSTAATEIKLEKSTIIINGTTATQVSLPPNTTHGLNNSNSSKIAIKPIQVIDDDDDDDEEEEIKYQKRSTNGNIDPVTLKCKKNFICVVDGYDFITETQRIKYGGTNHVLVFTITGFIIVILLVTSTTLLVMYLYLAHRAKHSGQYTVANSNVI